MSQINPDNKCAHLIKNVEYRKDAMSFMFNMQRNLQEFIAGKKGGIAPGKGDFRDEIDLGIYYFGCTTTEFFEFGERLNDFDWDWETIDIDEKLEIQYEYIDMWHFIMNQFLYTGLTELDLDMSLKEIITGPDSSVSEHYKVSELLDSTEKFWTSFSYTWGRYLNNLPYKKWKKYEDDAMSKVDNEEQVKLAKVMLFNFVKFGKLIDIDHSHFYNLYVSKNEENISRQEAGGVYHSE